MTVKAFTYTNGSFRTKTDTPAGIISNPATGLVASGYTARQDARNAIAMYCGSDPSLPQYAALVTFSDRAHVVFFADVTQASTFLRSYEPVSSILETVLFL